jgi:hypothetical protein
MNSMVRIVSIVSVLSLLSACGSSDGGGVPSEAPSAVLDGTVTDAVITNGTLRVFKFDDGKQGEFIAETVTDGNGDFEIADFTSQDRPIVIEVSGGRYTEEASGVSVDLLDGQVLRAYMFYEQGSAITLQVTPFTHMASCLADYKISAGVNVNNAITEATSVFSGLAGVDILGTKPLDITDPNNANFEVTDNLRYGAVLAAISSFTAEVSETNGVTPHRFNQNSSIYATQVLCQDIAADGVFNGLGFINNGNSVGQLSLGSVPLDVDTLRSKVAQHILSIISSDRNQTGLGVDEFVLYANEIASSTDAVFGGVPSTAVDQEGPTVTAVLAPDSFLKDIVNLDFVVTDPIGVKSVQFHVNDVVHSNGQVDAPVMSINSTNYTDGIIKITVVATDILNNVSNIDFNYEIDNTSPTIALTSATLVNNKAYTATGTYEEQGAPVASIQVNGTDAAIDTNAQTWSADIILLSGDNVVTLDITDVAANTNTVDISVGVDLIKPLISSFTTLATFTTFQGQLNLCTSGQITPTSGNVNPVCLSTDNISLNGAAIDGALQNIGYAMLGFSPTDPQGAGIFTGQDDLIVEYMYELNGVEVIAWSVAPKAAGSNLFYYFPMVTEYLGNTWYQTTTNDVHKVIFKVTDESGNFSELAYEIRFDILVPELATNSVIDDSLFSASTFANRTALDGSAITTSYSFDNTSNNSILISLSDSQLHSVKHSYETGVRENQARARVTETWRSKNCDNDWSKACKGVTQLPVSSVTFKNSHRFRNQTIYPAGNKYSAYQNVYKDSPAVTDLSGVPAVTPLAGYSCNNSDITQYNYFGGWVTAAYANGINSFSVCRYYDDDDTGPKNTFSELVSSVSQAVEIKSGFPRNNINSTTTDYNLNTEELTVVNSTLGQDILPVGGWYRVPPKTAISIVKIVRLPVLNHFYDNALANLGTFSSYNEKKLDKSTTWKIDTDLTITRVIDPGDIQEVNNVTPSISMAGLGIYQKTISR